MRNTDPNNSFETKILNLIDSIKEENKMINLSSDCVLQNSLDSLKGHNKILDIPSLAREGIEDYFKEKLGFYDKIEGWIEFKNKYNKKYSYKTVKLIFRDMKKLSIIQLKETLKRNKYNTYVYTSFVNCNLLLLLNIDIQIVNICKIILIILSY